MSTAPGPTHIVAGSESFTLEVPAKSAQGPAMLALTSDLQKRFVIAMVIAGASKGYGAEAARLAGYEPAFAKQMAYKLLRQENIIAALKEEAQRRLQVGAFLGTMVLEEIALDVMHKDRFKAATALMDRGGMLLVNRSEVTHTIKDERTTEELLAFIRQMAARHGPEVKQLVDQNIVDADFVELDPELRELMGDDDADDQS